MRDTFWAKMCRAWTVATHWRAGPFTKAAPSFQRGTLPSGHAQAETACQAGQSSSSTCTWKGRGLLIIGPGMLWLQRTDGQTEPHKITNVSRRWNIGGCAGSLPQPRSHSSPAAPAS